MKLNLRLLVVAGLFLLVDGVVANAGTVAYLNVPTNELTALDPVVTARYRLSRAGSADQMLFRQPDPAGFPSADPLAAVSPWVGSSTYTFTVTHTAATSLSGGKFVFGLTDGSLTGNISYREQGANSTIQQTFNLSYGGKAFSYNVLHIFAVAQTAGSSVAFSNLSFTTGSGLTTSGSLSTSGSISASSSYDQWIAAPTGTNLDQFDWTFSGRVTLTMGGTNPSSGEGIKFELTGKNGIYTPASVVPEPSTIASTLAGLGLTGLVARRSRRRS